MRGMVQRSHCAGGRIRKSECGRKNRPDRCEMTGVGMRIDASAGGCGRGERCRPKGTPLREERSGWQAGEAGNEQDGALKGRRYTEAKRDFIPRNARDGAEVSLRRPTHSQERMRKKKSACSVRNDGGRHADRRECGPLRARGKMPPLRD